MTQDEKVIYMTTRPVPRLIGEMAIPTIISMLITSFYNMADTYFVGQINTQSTAAVGIAFSIMSLIQACGFFFGHGSGNFISRALGARKYEEAEKMAATGFCLALITGILIALAGVIFITPISVALGSTETILPYTVKYLRVLFLGTPFIMGSFVVNNQLRFQGSASIAMVGIVTGAILNIALDPLLIFGFNMGVQGAAVATVFSQIVSFFILVYLNQKKAAIKIELRKFTPDRYFVSNIAKGGFPSLCRQGIGSIAVVCLNTAAGLYGGLHADAAIAAMGIVSRIIMFANSALIGFGQGFQPVCGTNYGAKKYDRVREAFFFCVKVGFVALIVLSVVGFTFARPLISLFRDDQKVIEIGVYTLRAQCIAFPCNAWIVMSNMMLQTIGMTKKASLIAASRQGIFFIPLVFVMPLFMGLTGVMLCQMVADFLALLLSIPFSLGVIRMMKEA